MNLIHNSLACDFQLRGRRVILLELTAGALLLGMVLAYGYVAGPQDLLHRTQLFYLLWVAANWITLLEIAVFESRPPANRRCEALVEDRRWRHRVGLFLMLLLPGLLPALKLAAWKQIRGAD